MHEVTSEHWHEPEGMKNAGYGAWQRPNTPYDDYMEAQGIPIFRGIGVQRVQVLSQAGRMMFGDREDNGFPGANALPGGEIFVVLPS